MICNSKLFVILSEAKNLFNSAFVTLNLFQGLSIFRLLLKFLMG